MLPAVDIIIITSCSLSLLGGLALLFSCLGRGNRKKHARELLFWLSLSDVLTSLAYIISISFPNSDAFCRVTALVGIFFPVASFIWTDIIAFYLYTIVVMGRFRSEKDWRQTMFWYHVVAWGIPLLIIIAVAATNHEGQMEVDDDEESSLKWCWVRGRDRQDQFIWELVAGKAVEWMSCIIITVLYVLIIRKLVQLSQRQRLMSDIDAEGRGRGSSNPRGPGINLSSKERALVDASEQRSPLIGYRAPSASGAGSPQVARGGMGSGEEGRGGAFGESSSSSNSNSSGIWQHMVHSSVITAGGATSVAGGVEAEDDEQSGIDTISLHSGHSTHTAAMAARGGDEDEEEGGQGGEGFSGHSVDAISIVSDVLPSEQTRINTEINANTHRQEASQVAQQRQQLQQQQSFSHSHNQSQSSAAMGASGGKHYSQQRNASGGTNRGANLSTGSGGGGGSGGMGTTYLNRFFVQMSVVPIVFFVSRFWGSLRILLMFFAPSIQDEHSTTMTWIMFLTAIFDPSQGFCNFLLFVMTSEDERGAMWLAVRSGMHYVHYSCRRSVPGYVLVSDLAGAIVGWLCCCGAEGVKGKGKSSGFGGTGTGSTEHSDGMHSDLRGSHASTKAWYPNYSSSEAGGGGRRGHSSASGGDLESSTRSRDRSFHSQHKQFLLNSERSTGAYANTNNNSSANGSTNGRSDAGSPVESAAPAARPFPFLGFGRKSEQREQAPFAMDTFAANAVDVGIGASGVGSDEEGGEFDGEGEGEEGEDITVMGTLGGEEDDDCNAAAAAAEAAGASTVWQVDRRQSSSSLTRPLL